MSIEITKDAVLVRIELIDVLPEHVDIVSSDRMLSVRGVRSVEGRYDAFVQTLPLPITVDGRSAIAIMNDGVLTIRIPRSVRPRACEASATGADP